MLRTALALALLCLAAPAMAFQSPVRGARCGAVSMMAENSAAVPFLPKPAELDGSMVGDVGFDPLGVSDWMPLDYLRESELKHGRICMLAVTGFAATDLGFKLPGEQFNVASIDAHNMAVTAGYMTVMGSALFVLECISGLAIQEMLAGSGRIAGDYGLDPLKLSGKADKLNDMKLKEITHARLAMLAFSGMVTQAVLTGKGFPYY